MKTQVFKAIAIAAIGLLSFSTANAQLKHGPVAGISLANQSGDVENNKMLFAFHAGWFVNFDVTDNISIAPQLLYSAKGCKIDPDQGDAFNINLNYIEIPIWGRYNLESGLHIDFGPYIGFLMSAKWDGEDKFGDTDIKDFYTGTDFGLGFGLGYELESGLGFAANYNLGLSNIADSDDGDLKNQVIKVSLSYTLGQ